MIELNPTQYPVAEPLFQPAGYGALVMGTLTGTHPGRVFLDQATDPKCGLVCSRAGIGYYFLAGMPSSSELAWLASAFQRDFLPAQESAAQNNEVVLFFDPPLGQEALFVGLAPFKPVRIQKKRMILTPTAAREIQGKPVLPLPHGMSLVSYTPDLLRRQPILRSEIELFYGKMDTFFACSFGYCILDGAAVASTCHAVFTGGGEVEISIATQPEYRRRGLAETTAMAFLHECLDRDLTPVWGCWPENSPSVCLSEKLGFVDDTDQPVCLWVDSPQWRQASPETGL